MGDGKWKGSCMGVIIMVENVWIRFKIDKLGSSIIYNKRNEKIMLDVLFLELW